MPQVGSGCVGRICCICCHASNPPAVHARPQWRAGAHQRSLPAQGLLVKTAKYGWRQAWKFLMTELAPQVGACPCLFDSRLCTVVGTQACAPASPATSPSALLTQPAPGPHNTTITTTQSKDGQYTRPTYSFNGELGSAEFPLEPGRYGPSCLHACLPVCLSVCLPVCLSVCGWGGVGRETSLGSWAAPSSLWSLAGAYLPVCLCCGGYGAGIAWDAGQPCAYPCSTAPETAAPCYLPILALNLAAPG